MGSRKLKETVGIGRALGARCLLATLLYSIRCRLRAAQAAPLLGSHSRSTDEALGRLLSYEADGQAVDLRCDNGILRIEVLTHDLLRLRLRRVDLDDFPSLFSYAPDPDAEWPPIPFSLYDNDALTIGTRHLTCRVDKDPCRLTFLGAGGLPLSEPGEGLGFRGDGVFCTRRLAGAEAIYGLAAKALDLNLRGHKVEMWNRDPACYSPGDDPINLNIPFLVGLCEGHAYGFFFDNPGRARFDLGQARCDQLRYEADTGELCAYFFAGPTVRDVLRRYTHLTGRMPLPPRWMLGYHQSRWSYYPAGQVRELAAEFRRRRIPCDVIHLDIHHMDGYRVFTWDPDRFPDPPRLLAELREQGFRVIGIVDPGVKVDPGYPVYDEGLARDAFCRLPDGKRFQGPVWPGNCHFPDFTDPEVRAWWGDLYRPLLEAGIAGFWNDMNEPAIFGGEMPHDVCHSYDGQGASHGEVHNVYGLQMARASAEGLRRLRPQERLPLISRSGYAGLQRYALVWTGDNESTWAQLRLGVSMCLNLGMSGVAFCGPDVGGFAGDCDGELLARWTQVGALTPFFRNHSAFGTRNQEPWVFGEPYESICRRWIELRYELLPYIYTAAWQASRSGLPMMRPLAMVFPKDTRTYSQDDQFMAGDALLAAPIVHPGQTSRQVYLPGGPWYDFWTNERHDGEVVAAAPLERMPLFVRAGSVLPLGPGVQHTGEWAPGALQLHIYPGDGESWLYEDDGHSQAYRAGQSRLTRFVCTFDGYALAVRREVEGPFQPGYQDFDVHVHGLDNQLRQVQVDGVAKDANYHAKARTVRLSVRQWSHLEVT